MRKVDAEQNFIIRSIGNRQTSAKQKQMHKLLQLYYYLIMKRKTEEAFGQTLRPYITSVLIKETINLHTTGE
jgi:hypothetical protein